MKTHARQLTLFVVLAYAISWLIWLPGILAMNGNYQLGNFGVLLYLGAFGPSLAAIIVTALGEGWPGVRRLLAKLVRWRVGWTPYAALFFVLPLVFLGVFLVSGLPLKEGALFEILFNVVLFMPLNALIVTFVEAGPLGEELGWRGFLLPRLLESLGDRGSSLILGLIWAFWHLPLFLFADWRSGVSLITFALLYPLTLIAFSFAMTKLWHWTRGSVLTAVLFHAVLNYATGRIIDPQRFDLASRSSLNVYLIAVVAFAALALVFWALDAWTFRAWKGARKKRDAAV